MLVFSSENAIRAYLDNNRTKSLGFVPTMGALHEGHLQLVDRAASENDLVVVSIFVNPAQFNNRNDLLRYPRTLEKDLEMLESRGCDLVFAPTEEEIYPSGYKEPDLELGELDSLMEGQFRPGHFKGVVMVVKRLFEILSPQKAYFGMKDFQQVAVVKRLNAEYDLVPEIVACPTIRESSGLAMSSRNQLLSSEERAEAAVIFQTLSEMRVMAGNGADPGKIKEWAEKNIKENSSLKPEYVEIVDELTLRPLSVFTDHRAVACIAAWAGKVRLIDNLPIFP